MKSFKEDTKLLLLCPIAINEDRDLKTVLKVLSQQGYARIKYEDDIYRIDDLPTDKKNYKNLNLVVDRVVVKNDEDFFNRLSDAVQTAFFEGNGICVIQNLSDNSLTEFNNKFELDGIVFFEPNTHFFSFNLIINLLDILIRLLKHIPAYIFIRIVFTNIPFNILQCL